MTWHHPRWVMCEPGELGTVGRMTDRYDVIIGSGAGGGTLAHVLVRR
jgi:hypothetical protein